MRRGDRACSCGAGTHWVSTWSAAPGDAGGYYTPDDGGLLLEFVTHWFDNSFNVKLPPVEETAQAAPATTEEAAPSKPAVN